jgi:hypothetical protein
MHVHPGGYDAGMDDREHTRIEDKKKFAGQPAIEGVPEEEDVEGTDVEERLDEDPEQVPSRRDVPDPPQETITPPAADQ